MQMPLSSGTYTIYIYHIQNPGKPLCRPARRASSRSQPKPGHRYQERAGVSFGVYAYIYIYIWGVAVYKYMSRFQPIYIYTAVTPAHIYKHPRTRVYIYGAALLGPPSPPTPWYPPSPPVVPCGVGSPLALPPCGRGRLPWLLLVGRPVAKGLDLRM